MSEISQMIAQMSENMIWISKDENAFLMDFENACLFGWRKDVPKGRKRYEDPEWQEHIKPQLEFSDTSWERYKLWVQAGGGDEWFQDVQIHNAIQP